MSQDQPNSMVRAMAARNWSGVLPIVEETAIAQSIAFFEFQI
jgi:hypothetical protein